MSSLNSRWTNLPLKYLTRRMRSGSGITSEDIDEVGEFPVYGGNGIRGYTASFTHNGTFVLVGRQGALCGNVHLVEGTFWASEHAVVVSPSVLATPRYLAYLMRHLDLGQYSVSAAQPGLAVERIRQLPVLVPAVAMQEAIAAFLDQKTAAIDALIAKKERLIELLQEKRQALITQAVTKGLDPKVPMKDSGIEWLGEIPKHWGVVALKRTARPGYKTFTDGDWIEAPYVTDSGVRLLQTGNVGIGQFREKGFRYVSQETFHQLRCTEVEPGDLLVCRLDGPVGRACIAPDLGVKMITSVDNAIIKVDRAFDVRFLVYFLSMPGYFEWVLGLCRVGGGHRFRVSRSMLGDFQVVAPSKQQQVEIADYLDRETGGLAAVESKIASQVEKLREYRQGLISAAVTGQIFIQEGAER